MHNYGMSRAEAEDVLNMLAVGIIIGSPLMSFLSNRIFRSRKIVLMLSAGLLLVELVFMNFFSRRALPNRALSPDSLLFRVFSDAGCDKRNCNQGTDSGRDHRSLNRGCELVPIPGRRGNAACDRMVAGLVPLDSIRRLLAGSLLCNVQAALVHSIGHSIVHVSHERNLPRGSRRV